MEFCRCENKSEAEQCHLCRTGGSQGFGAGARSRSRRPHIIDQQDGLSGNEGFSIRREGEGALHIAAAFLEIETDLAAGAAPAARA